jgi:hypothetical protein
MNLKQLVEFAIHKDNFINIDDYLGFALSYLEFIKTNLQAVIVSQNENHYRFFQYKEEGTFNVTRPINSRLMLGFEDFEQCKTHFKYLLKNIKNDSLKTTKNAILLNNIVYTAQQSIGATLDALPAKKSNTARKMNGDLFERFIRLLLCDIGIEVKEGHCSVPVKVNDEILFQMNYQHDLIIKSASDIKAIGSVKTSSKDRIDKIFIDKLLYNKLTGTEIPHFAIFLNDVQRKGKEGKYGVNTTFLSGHFKGYTVKLTPLDGVYYCDIRPNMLTENILKTHIKTFDHLLFYDIWEFIK